MDRKEGQTLFEVTPEISHFAELCEKNNAIDKELYTKYEVKRGLRDLNGKGVLAGLTNISDVCAKKIVNGEEVPCAGNLYYRGYNIKDLVQGFLKDKHYGFEEIAYLLLFGELPDKTQLQTFHETLVERRTLPPTFVRDVIMKAPSRDMMNSLSRSILSLYTYDPHADDTSIPNVLRQCLNLISQFPMLMIYGYHAYNYRMGEDLFIYAPSPELSTAENILMMLRENKEYTKLEAKIPHIFIPFLLVGCDPFLRCLTRFKFLIETSKTQTIHKCASVFPSFERCNDPADHPSRTKRQHSLMTGSHNDNSRKAFRIHRQILSQQE